MRPLLHDFLCDAPHLLYLRAHRTNFKYQHLDVFSSPSPITSIFENALPQQYRPQPPRIWTCRQLRSLELSVPSASDYPNASRLIFGYISRVCPELTDVELSGPEVECKTKDESRRLTLCMVLEGGLCLLGRLRKMRTLRVGIRDATLLVKQWDVNWMLPGRPSTGDASLKDEEVHAARSRKQRRDTIAFWRKSSQSRQQQAKIVQQRICAVEKWRDDTAIGESTLEVLLQLVHCGLLSDVEKMIEDLDNGDIDCWPGLRRLALYQDCSIGQSCEQEVSRVASTDDDASGLCPS